MTTVVSALGRTLDPSRDETRVKFFIDGVPKRDWTVQSLHGEELLSQPYDFQVSLATEEGDPSQFLGADCVVQLDERCFAGVVRRVERCLRRERHLAVTLHVSPALTLLDQIVDCRIFQNTSVPRLLEKLLADELGKYLRNFEFHLSATYLDREYIVQYRESTLDFVRRLMAEEGISFWFTHGEHEVLHLGDSQQAFGPCATSADPLTLGGEGLGNGTLHDITFHAGVGTAKGTVRSFDWTRPSLTLQSHAVAADSEHVEREVYDFEPSLTRSDYSPDTRSYTKSDEKRQVGFRLAELRGRTSNITGQGQELMLFAGGTFRLTSLQHAEVDATYLVTRIAHTFESPGKYSNHFFADLAETEVRPPLRRRQVLIPGTQTATVVGPADEEIYTDEHGRVKVQFHWDRLGSRNERSSCWVRVMQGWAGPGFGTFFLPRIGMEVVVTFLEGDPEHPLVTGCVYNGANPAPYPLPEDRTRSTIKSRSSLGGNGYNEFRFEDKAGAEEIFVHAQKDHNRVVLNNETISVGANQSTSVALNQANAIGINQATTVGNDRVLEVGGHQVTHVGRNTVVTIDGSHSMTINGEETAEGVTGGNLRITGDYIVNTSKTIYAQAPDHIKLECGGSSILIEPNKITILAGGKALIELDANALIKSSQPSSIFMNQNIDVHSQTGSQLKMDATILAQSKETSALLLDANARLASKAQAVLYLDDTKNASLTANNVVLAGETQALLAQGKDGSFGGAVTTEASSVIVNGQSITVGGGSDVTIQAGVVKVN